MRGLIYIAASLSMLVMAGPALAQSAPQATNVSKHNDWGVYSFVQNKAKVCYALTVPKDKQPPTLNHGDMFFLVSQKPGQNVSYEPQFLAGYTFKEGSKVEVSVDGKSYSMFTKGTAAWMENAAEEPALLSAMRAGSEMTVKATSGRGNPTSYIFSLKGISAALQSIASCK